MACTLASTDPKWPEKATFQNLIDATKRIGGLSFGDILKHPRCSDPSSAKQRFSKAAVNEVKSSLESLSEEEKDSKLQTAVADLKSYDDALDALDPQHIPAKKTMLEFHLTKDIQPNEIFDYCIVHGKEADDMHIQSFFNFGVQKFTNGLRQKL